MPKWPRSPVLLAAIASLVYFAGLGSAHLWDVDEAIFAEAAKEMFARADFIVPYFNGEVFTHKPIMMYWFMIGAYELFGTSEFAARFFSAVFGVGSVLLTYRLGRLLFSPSVGFLAGLVLASNLNFSLIARAATPDSYLTFFSTLAILAFVWGTRKPTATAGTGDAGLASWAGQTTFEPSWGAWILAYAAMGCGVLTKGPIGVLLPTAVIGQFLLIARVEPLVPSPLPGWRGAVSNLFRRAVSVFGVRHFLRTVWSMRPLTAVAVVLAVAGPWYTLVGIHTDGEWLVGFFGVHNFGRFLGAMENHRGPIFYYLLAIAIGFFPWCVLFQPSLSLMKKRLAPGDPWRPGYLLVGCWAAVWVGFFSLAGTKLPSYVIPAYPALALFIGPFLDRWLGDAATVNSTWNRRIWGTIGLVGLVMVIALPILAHKYLDNDWLLATFALVPLAAAAAGFYFATRGESGRAVATLAALGVVLSIALFDFGAARIDRFQASAAFGQQIAQAAHDRQPLAVGSYRYFRPSMVFYTGCPIPELESAESVQAFFAAHPGDAFLFTTDEALAAFGADLPADVTVIGTRPRFLQRGNILLLGRAPLNAAAEPPAGSPATARQ